MAADSWDFDYRSWNCGMILEVAVKWCRLEVWVLPADVLQQQDSGKVADFLK